MRSEWAAQEDFILCEHDMIFERRHMDELADCADGWCTASQEFQITRWRGSFIRSHPDAFSQMPLPYRHWFALAWSFRSIMGESGCFEHRHGDAPSRAVNKNSLHAFNDPQRVAEWASWLRTLPDDTPDFSIPVPHPYMRLSWRLWAWCVAPYAPNRRDWPCSQFNCRRGHHERRMCSTCIEGIYPDESRRQQFAR